MIESEIERLKVKLYSLLDSNVDFAEIYELSVRLDKLIVEYYSSIYSERTQCTSSKLQHGNI